MDRLRYRIYYERHLPHIQPPGATLFLTYRLAGSLPAAMIQRLKEEAEQIEKAIARLPASEQAAELYKEQRRQFGKWDSALDAASCGPRWLENASVAQVVAGSLHFLDGEVYELDCYCIMPNHGHAVFTPLVEQDDRYHSLSKIMHSHKRFTAREANKLLGRQGQFWQRESYDHIVRDEKELQRIRRYVLLNPVKAGLVEAWDRWPWSYSKYGLSPW